MNTNRPAGQGPVQARGFNHAARPAACLVLLLALLIPPNLCAQTAPLRTSSGTSSGPVRGPQEGYDPDGKAIVALLPFTGDRESAAQFNAAAIQAVADLGPYSPRQVSRETVAAAGLRIPTDMPPVQELTPGVRYALTGGVYPADDEAQAYLQLWLWDMNSSAMIYTDDLVYEDIDSALESLPGLVEWLFSHIIEQPAEAEPGEETGWDNSRLNVGIRSGLSQHWYTAPNESIPGAYSLTYEGGFFVAVQINSLITLQAEADFIWDDLVYRGVDNTAKDITYNPVLANEQRHSFSMLFPVLVKLSFRPGSFRFSPYGGLFFFAPLGEVSYSRYPERADGGEGSFSWSSAAPLGFSFGFEVARKLGPGIISADIRYSTDFGNITIHDSVTNPGKSETVYKRNMLSFIIGYSFGLMDMKK
jgi:hypothetical protein